MFALSFMLVGSEHLQHLLALPFIKRNQGCQKLIRNAQQYHLNLYKQPLMTCMQNQPRGMKDFLMVHGGELNRDENTWRNKDTKMKLYVGTKQMLNGPHALPDNCANFPSTYVFGSVNAVRLNNFIFLFGADNDLWVPVSK